MEATVVSLLLNRVNPRRLYCNLDRPALFSKKHPQEIAFQRLSGPFQRFHSETALPRAGIRQEGAKDGERIAAWGHAACTWQAGFLGPAFCLTQTLHEHPHR